MTPLEQVALEAFIRFSERILAEIEKVGFETFKRRVEDAARGLQFLARPETVQDTIRNLERELRNLTGGNA